MTVVLTLVKLDAEGSLTGPVRAALTFARDLASSEGAQLHAVAVGTPGEEVLAGMREQGVSHVHAVSHPLLDDYAPEAWGESLAQLLASCGAQVVIAPATARGNEVMAHLAARTDLAMVANCTAFQAADDGWELTRHRWGGVLYEDAHLDAEVALVTVASHTMAAVPADTPGAAEVVAFSPQLDADLARTGVRDKVTHSTGVSLATAPVVVAGGRGVGSAEGFALLEELAELLGGAVGCSRVATNNGWRSHNDQVGQTGTRIAPDLYIALGISGATQHWVGCMGAKRILAVNTDAEAPMVSRADYAVIGNLHALLPAVVDEVRRRKKELADRGDR